MRDTPLRWRVWSASRRVYRLGALVTHASAPLRTHQFTWPRYAASKEFSMATDRELIQKWWQDAWTEGLWSASWSKSLDGLTPDQAAWQPPSAPGVTGNRNSIHQ